MLSRSRVPSSPWCAAFVGKKIKTAVWHKRLGHPSEEVLAVMLKKSEVIPSIDVSPSVCTACIQGKMTKLPFPISQDRSTVVFERIHSDIWGPSPQKSVEGYRYYISLVDDCSRFVWIFPMVNKSDAFTIFSKFLAFVENQFNASIKFLQSDGGGEYMSNMFRQLLAIKELYIKFLALIHLSKMVLLKENIDIWWRLLSVCYQKLNYLQCSGIMLVLMLHS